MAQPSLRHLAKELGLSIATVSRAMHRDPRVRKETKDRVTELLQKWGYQLDPVVSSGLSRVRRREFYRETIAWCADETRSKKDWLHPLLEAAEAYGRTSGYDFDYFTVDPADPVACRRLVRLWKARGICGVIFLPFRETHTSLPFPWNDMCWVRIGHSLQQPRLHVVGRDYHADLSAGCEWLAQQGCHRPGFVCYQDISARTVFRQPLLEFSLTYYYEKADSPPKPYLDITTLRAREMRAWLSDNRFDSMFIPTVLPSKYRTVWNFIRKVPTVFLSPPNQDKPLPRMLSFIAPYPTLGEVAVNMLNRMLQSREFGIPSREHRVLLSSDPWSPEAGKV